MEKVADLNGAELDVRICIDSEFKRVRDVLKDKLRICAARAGSHPAVELGVRDPQVIVDRNQFRPSR